MLNLELANFKDRPRRILCLGAHCDDIEIGCGGTLLSLLRRFDHVSCRWVVFSGNAARRQECLDCADAFLAGAQEEQVEVLDFRDGFMPYHGAKVKDVFERLKHEISPDLVFTHYLQDRHQDHRLLSELTWNTFRDHLILEYEIPKWDGDFGQPNLFTVLDDDLCRRKIDALMNCYETQRSKRWFSEETFRAVLTMRGIEAGSPTGYAEAFYGRKTVLQ